jgi:DNA-binding NtrC family response regulator
MNKILIIEDEFFVAKVISKYVEAIGFETAIARTKSEGLKMLKEENPIIVLLDNHLPDGKGIDIIKEIKEFDSLVQIIMITGAGNVPTAVKAVKLGAYDYLEKQRDLEKIPVVVNNAFEKVKLIHEIANADKDVKSSLLKNELIGESEEIKRIKKLINIIAPNNMSVFLEGETGSGKSIIAKLIHENSDRSDKNFVTVDCGAIPESLFESEMFGHEKGSFTGAIHKHKGYFERANGGTIFLDEISNLSLGLQTKLLRVIQEKQIVTVGGENPIALDVRIIAASNKNLLDLIKNEQFKDDLYYRINEINIVVPALKDRKDDIPLLANYFLRKTAKELNKNTNSYTIEALNMLIEHDWPGNIRELENVIKKAVLFENSNIVQAKNINIQSELTTHKASPDDEFNINRKITEYKDLLIKNALIVAGGNKTNAAKLLGISRRQLYRYLD